MLIRHVSCPYGTCNLRKNEERQLQSIMIVTKEEARSNVEKDIVELMQNSVNYILRIY